MIRVIVAEDHHIVRRALVALLEQSPDISVVADVGDGTEILDAVREHRPDVAILDVDLPGMDGIEAAELIRAEVDSCRVLVLTSISRPGVLRRALNARVSGFLRKDAPPAELAMAVRQVAGGGRVIDPDLALSVWDLPENPLTPREAEVLLLAAEGHEIEEIATKLFLSHGTVRNYLAAIVTKVNARNRVDAIRIAREADWI